MIHPHLMSDQELVHAYQKGNDHALAELLVRYKERIYSVIFYLVRRRELAEDLFQDCFVKIITNLNLFKICFFFVCRRQIGTHHITNI